jgi:hypothetical protein
MKILNILNFLCLLSTHSYSQTFFSSIPDLGGDEMEGKILNVIPLENEIKIIGLVHDSMVSGFDGGTWPVLGTISYDGEYQGTTLLIDSLYSDGFYYFTRRLAFKNDSICYLYDRRDLGAPLLDAYLIELNFKTGKILHSKIIYDQFSNKEGFLATDLTIGKNGNIYLVNVIYETGPNPQILTVLDSNLNILSQVHIPNYDRDNITKYIEENPDGNLVLVGVSLGEANSVWFESKLFRQVLDKNFNSIDFRLAPTSLHQSILFFDSYPIIKAKSGNWVIAAQVVKATNDCQGCSIWIPYVVCISSDFMEVRWETRLFDGNFNSSEPEFNVPSITEVSDGYIFAGSSIGSAGIETSGILGKVSLFGDSLWLKHIIPVEWDTIQGKSFQLQDIKTTPDGNIVIGGFGSDSYTSRVLPWILHLDKDGCIEPGCNTTALSNDLEELGVDINIFPNPAINNCSIQIHSQHSYATNLDLSIMNDEGKLIYKTHVLTGDYQYLIDLKAWEPGVYFVQLMNNTGSQITKKFVVLK